MKIRTLAGRIIQQLRHDRRTMGLVLFAPLLVLGLLYLVLNGSEAEFTVIAGKAPVSIVEELKNQDDMKLKIIAPDGRSWNKDVKISDENDLKKAIDEKSAIGAFTISKKDLDARMYLDGSDTSSAAKLTALLNAAIQKESARKQKRSFKRIEEQLEKMQAAVNAQAAQPQNISGDSSYESPALTFKKPEIKTTYIYGKESSSVFDTYGAALVGLIVFLFVFLIAGINFLNERTSGTLEKMMQTPIKRSEIVLGYTLGFSVVAILQTTLVTLFIIYVIGMQVAGSIWYVFLINLLTAVCALTLGILLSSLASSEFQMVQFIPVVIVPQVFLCGMFSLSRGWDIAGHFTPLYYTNNAMQNVILRGRGFSDIWVDAAMLCAFSAVFMLLNIAVLKKERA